MDTIKKAEELWNKLSAIVESTCDSDEILKPILEEIKRVFGKYTEIGHKATIILLTRNDFSMIEIDNLKYLIHEFLDGRSKEDKESLD